MKRFIFILFFFSTTLFAHTTVSDYQRIFLPVYTQNNQLLIATRIFKMNNIPTFLTVNPTTLETQIIPVIKLKPRALVKKKIPGYFSQWNIASSIYYQLLNKNTAAPYPLKNQGIKHIDSVHEGNVLSIDLCPSRKPFEAVFFNELVKMADQNKKPTPVTIAISGLWLIQHPQEFQWLITKRKEKKLDITWANHSFSHIYYQDLPYSENFLLSPATNLDVEFLLTEKYLIEAGETPSVFFRFPGLVSNEALITQLKQLGLIPLGADAWIALHQNITPGGVILVHGNSNEHAGIVELVPKLKTLILLNIKKALTSL